MGQLKVLAKKCSTPAMTAEEHRDQLIMDAFISGISSASIRQCLLETDDSKISLDSLYNQAISMEMATNDAQSLSTSLHQNMSVAATKRTTCLYCGGAPHKTRSTCPAKNSTCAKCQKPGHWAKVCLSSKPSHSLAQRKNKAAAVTYSSKDATEEEETICSL